jgi:hypothetical protein
MGENTVTNQKIDAGKMFKKTIIFQDREFTPHRLSIGDKIKVGVLSAQRSAEMKLDVVADNLAYISAWLDVALDKKDNPEWEGALNIYDEEFIIDLYETCHDAVEKPFFRSQSVGKESGANKTGDK